MKLEQIKRVSVIGSGTMGNGIAQVFAAHEYDVTLLDIDQKFIEKAQAAITKSLDRMVKKEKITEAVKAAIIERITTSTDLKTVVDSQLVVEAITENLEIKHKLYDQLNAICRPETVLASNTSSLPITQLARIAGRPDKFVGMHFMNPVPMMKLVEVIRGMATSDETFELIWALSEKLGKTPIESSDYPGFIGNRILMPMINEAIFAHMEGVGSVEAIDGVMKLGMGHPMGPLWLADFIGLDVVLAILRVMHEGIGDPKYRPCPLLIKMVQAGYLGRKTGRGFYNYEDK